MNDDDWMKLALQQAEHAAAKGEVPVGAVLVHEGRAIATAHNLNRCLHDPTAHAEILVLRDAARLFGNFRLHHCELFVTLEPCAMCAGAMLHARLKRVVYGAADPKTGAAGSVLDVFAVPQLNHQTSVQGGIQSSACAGILQDFFQKRRMEHKSTKALLRQDALRTPLERFDSLPPFSWPSYYITELPTLAGLRMHYVDTAPHEKSEHTILCLHGVSSWSVIFNNLIQQEVQTGKRVLIPDLIGFGKSDKPKKESTHNISFHVQYLLEWLKQLNATCITVVAEGLGKTLGNELQKVAPERFVALPVQTYITAPLEEDAYNAPFPNAGYCAAVRALKKWEIQQGTNTRL